MSTAVAKAKTTEPETNFTALEMWRAVAALRISLYPPREPMMKWLAGWSGQDEETGKKCHLHIHGETPVAAVENLLRAIGGANG